MKTFGNDGSRPSRLDQARALTGETSDVSPDAAFVAELEAERSRTEPFHHEAIRARAHRLPEEDALRPARAPVPWWKRAWLAFPILATAALALFFLRPPEDPNRVKGEDSLEFYLLRGGQLYPGDPGASFHEGDQIRFTYRTDASGLVLVSIDGLGRLSQFYPETGEEPVPVVPGERQALEGSVILDDAPGPEVFVAFFGEDWTVTRAHEVVGEAWEDDGRQGVVALADTLPDVAVLVLEKR